MDSTDPTRIEADVAAHHRRILREWRTHRKAKWAREHRPPAPTKMLALRSADLAVIQHRSLPDARRIWQARRC